MDWMRLLAVPIVISFAGGIISGYVQREASQSATLNNYLDQLEKLVLEHKLLDKSPESGSAIIARGRTITALRELDWKRRTQLINFLKSSGLLEGSSSQNEAIISFKEVNLSGMGLDFIDFSNADFSHSYLNSSNLKNSIMRGTNFTQAELKKSNLQNADMRDANIAEADLEGTNFQGADLAGANLQGAVNLTEEQLTAAKLCRTTFPNGITLDPNRDCAEFDIDPETGKRIQ